MDIALTRVYPNPYAQHLHWPLLLLTLLGPFSMTHSPSPWGFTRPLPYTPCPQSGLAGQYQGELGPAHAGCTVTAT